MEKNIQKKFDKIQNEIRIAIMNFIIDNERPFSIENDEAGILHSCGINDETYRDSVSCLKEKDGMVTDEENKVNFIYPVSAMPAKHRVTLSDGRSFNAMCALDAMGSAFTFHQDIEIRSVCTTCEKPIFVKIKNGKLLEYAPEDLHVLSFLLEELPNWAGSC